MQGNDLFNTLRIRREVPWEGISPRMLDYWTPENQDTDIPGMIDGAYRDAQMLENKVFISQQAGETSRWVEDASFIKLKTLTLSYNFRKDMLNSIGFSKIRLYLTAANVFTITEYTGFDPEVAQYADQSGGDAKIGVDFSVYPMARTYTFGIDFSF